RIPLHRPVDSGLLLGRGVERERCGRVDRRVVGPGHRVGRLAGVDRPGREPTPMRALAGGLHRGGSANEEAGDSDHEARGEDERAASPSRIAVSAAAAFAWPRVAFMTCPIRNLIACSLPATTSATAAGFAARISSTIALSAAVSEIWRSPSRATIESMDSPLA